MTSARPARYVARIDGELAGRECLVGVCPEVASGLTGYRLPERTVVALTRMVPSRQVAAANIMVRQNNVSGDFARALLAATPGCQRADDPRGRQSNRDRARLLAEMERGLVGMQETARDLAAGYHDDLFFLALIASFVRGWMEDDVVRDWLGSQYAGNAATLERIASASDCAKKAKRPMKLAYSLADRQLSPGSSLRRSKRCQRTHHGVKTSGCA